jgi:hypothetical protein
LFEIPLKYARFGMPNESTIMAHNTPIIPPIIRAVNKYFGVEHKLDELQNMSAIITRGNITNVAIFWVCKLLTLMK